MEVAGLDHGVVRPEAVGECLGGEGALRGVGGHKVDVRVGQVVVDLDDVLGSAVDGECPVAHLQVGVLAADPVVQRSGDGDAVLHHLVRAVAGVGVDDDGAHDGAVLPLLLGRVVDLEHRHHATRFGLREKRVADEDHAVEDDVVVETVAAAEGVERADDPRRVLARLGHELTRLVAHLVDGGVESACGLLVALLQEPLALLLLARRVGLVGDGLHDLARSRASLAK